MVIIYFFFLNKILAEGRFYRNIFLQQVDLEKSSCNLKTMAFMKMMGIK